MKRGCFIKSFMLFFIIGGVGIYLFQKYGDALLEEGKTKLTETLKNEFVEQIKSLDEGEFVDSLRIGLENKLKGINNDEEILKLKEEFKNFFEDNRITKQEYYLIKEKLLSNERSKKN